jgi:hypothetical protein
MFRKLYLRLNMKGRRHLLCSVMRFAFSKGPNEEDASLPSPEDGNRPSLRNVVFSNNLEFRIMHKVYEPIDSECYTPSSEPFKEPSSFLKRKS